MGLPFESDSRPTVVVAGRALAWWRVMFAAGVAPALLQAVAMALCPESPVWLLWKGAHAAARRSFGSLHGQHFSPGDHAKLREEAPPGLGVGGRPGSAGADAPLLAEEGSGGGEQAQELGWRALWQPRYRRVMVLAGGLPLLQQLCGINTVIYYSSSLFRMAGLQSPIMGSIFMGLTNLVRGVGWISCCSRLLCFSIFSIRAR